MPRNLDLTALRAFVTVADAGGVTRAAGLLNFTQSAVSMQLKRLEEGLGQQLFTRAARQLALTPVGEQLLIHARKMLDINDMALSHMTDATYEGTLRLGVPHDIVYPEVPRILKRMASEYPRLQIDLASTFSTQLLAGFGRGEFDMIVTTEAAPGPQAEVLASRRLVWVGAPDSRVWAARPLRLAFADACLFRPIAQEALTKAGIEWQTAFAGQGEQVIDAMITADLAITARIEGGLPAGTQAIEPGNALPDLGALHICLYDAGVQKGPMVDSLLAELRCAFGC